MSEDDFGFWDGDRRHSSTGPIQRLKRATPSTASAPARATRQHLDQAESHPVEVRPVARRSGQPNPVARRLGALCAVGLLAVPVAFVLRGSNNDATINAAEAAATVAAPTVTTIPLSVPTEAAAAAEITVARVEPLDTARPVGVATPAVATAERRRVCDIDYTVVAGDYWISIARNWSVKLAVLLTANGATASTPLYPGRHICLPAGAQQPTSTVTATTAKPSTSSATPAAKTTPTTTKTTPTTAKPPTTTTPKPTARTTPTTTKPKPPSTTSAPTTAAPTTAAPSTTAAPPANNYTRAEVEQIIRNVWPDDLEDEAVRIATRESNLVPTVRNYCCYGLFQIYFTANKSSLVSWGITSASRLYDPQVNAYAAYAMYLRAGGWGPWAL
ncbi:MAG: hypothetical protein JWN62_2506 [Acidimicrobiales bacterium]|nr:hypothetical protein [Acidimicrobiales bacterium]